LGAARPGRDQYRLAGACRGAHQCQRSPNTPLEMFQEAPTRDDAIGLLRDCELLPQRAEPCCYPCFARLVLMAALTLHATAALRGSKTQTPPDAHKEEPSARAQTRTVWFQ